MVPKLPREDSRVDVYRMALSLLHRLRRERLITLWGIRLGRILLLGMGVILYRRSPLIRMLRNVAMAAGTPRSVNNGTIADEIAEIRPAMLVDEIVAFPPKHSFALMVFPLAHVRSNMYSLQELE
jgi:hypothetical protein